MESSQTGVEQSNSLLSPERKSRSLSPSKSESIAFTLSIKKKVRGLVVDLHGIIQQWKNLGQKSFQTLTSLDSTCAQLHSSSEQCKSGQPSATECWRNYKVALLKLRESLLDDHSEQMKQMSELYINMENIISNLEAMDLMNSVIAGDLTSSRNTADALFSSWTAGDFYRISRSIVNCYTKDWLLKQELSNSLTNSDVVNAKSSLYLSIWLQQPYLCEEAEFSMEGMLLECGLK